MDSSVSSSPILSALPELRVDEDTRVAAVRFVEAMQEQGFKAIASDFDFTLTKVHTWNYDIKSDHPFGRISTQDLMKSYFSNPENDVFSDFKLLYTIIKEARQRGIPFYICTRGFPENVVNFLRQLLRILELQKMLLIKYLELKIVMVLKYFLALEWLTFFGQFFKNKIKNYHVQESEEQLSIRI